MSDEDEFIPGRDPKMSVCKKPFEEWIKGWHKWYLGIPEDRHPTLATYTSERREDQEQNRRSLMGVGKKDECDDDSWVWFLAGGYGGSVATRSFVPPGNFVILAPVYVGWASTDEYPSLDTPAKLNKHLDHDIEYLELKATLDGINIPIHHVKIDSKFKATLPDNNILGLPVTPSIKTRDIEIVSNGHWIWLNPLPIGEHRLHLYGYSSHYAAELNATLSVAGPRVP